MPYRELYLGDLPTQFPVPKALYKYLQDHRHDTYIDDDGQVQPVIDRDQILFLLNIFRYLAAQARYNPGTVMEGESIVKANVADPCLLQDIGFLTYNLREPLTARFIKPSEGRLFIHWPKYMRFAGMQYMSCHMRVDYSVYSRIKGRYRLLFYLWHRTQANHALRSVCVIKRQKFRELFGGVKHMQKTVTRDAVRDGKVQRETVVESVPVPLMRDTPSVFRKVIAGVVPEGKWTVTDDEIHFLPIVYEKNGSGA